MFQRNSFLSLMLLLLAAQLWSFTPVTPRAPNTDSTKETRSPTLAFMCLFRRAPAQCTQSYQCECKPPSPHFRITSPMRSYPRLGRPKWQKKKREKISHEDHPSLLFASFCSLYSLFVCFFLLRNHFPHMQ